MYIIYKHVHHHSLFLSELLLVLSHSSTVTFVFTDNITLKLTCNHLHVCTGDVTAEKLFKGRHKTQCVEYLVTNFIGSGGMVTCVHLVFVLLITIDTTLLKSCYM